MYKKILFILLVATLSVGTTFAQVCTPNSQYTNPGLYPGVGPNFASGTVGQPYNQVLTVVVASDTLVSGITVNLDSARITGVAGLPSGLQYDCSDNLCTFDGGTSGCMSFTGTPASSGSYPLEIYRTNYYYHSLLGIFVVQDTITGYQINIGTVVVPPAVCTPDPQYTNPGLYPGVGPNLASGTVGQPYDQVLTVVVAADTLVSGITVNLDSARITGVAGLPSGLQYDCSDNLCTFDGGSSGCLSFTGTPVFSGLYPLEIYRTNYYYHSLLGIFVVDDTITGYQINIDTVVVPPTVCTPDPQYTNPGYYPDTTINFVQGYLNQPYNQVMTVVVAQDTIVSGIPLDFDSIRVTAVVGLPSGLQYDCSDPLCTFDGGTSGCINFSGTPTQSGTFPLLIYANRYLYSSILGPIFAADTIRDYEINISGVVGLGSVTSNKFEILQNAPNPFSDFTTIAFNSPQVGKVEFTVCDVLGKVVYNEGITAQKGINQYRFSAAGHAPGVYIYNLSNGIQSYTKRMVIANK